MKTIKMTITDINAIQNSIDYNDPKVVKAMQADRDYSITLAKKTIAAIKYGVIKNGKYFFTVINGEVIQDTAHTHSTNPLFFATHAAKQAGYNVKEA